MSDETQDESQASAAPAQREKILERLLSLVAEALPAASGAEAVHVPFLEMGANSLVLLEFQRTVENIWGVTIQVPQFFEELTTIDALATYIDQQLDGHPADAAPPAAVAAPQAPLELDPNAPAPLLPDLSVPLEGVEPGSELEQIFNQQMRTAAQTINQVVEQQLQFLREVGLADTVAPRDATREKAPSAPATASASTPDSAVQPQKMLSPLEIRARGLNARQQQHLEALIDRYTARTHKSKEHVQHYRQALADSRATVGFRFTTKEMLYPIVGSRARGARVWDLDGNEYVDITMGQGVTLFGHHPDFIEQALRAQPADVMQLGPRPPQAGTAAELICELTGMDRVTFTNTGTEAVMAALRLARVATGRHKIVVFEGAYHGHADSVMGTPVKQEAHLETRPVSPGTPPGAVQDLWILEYGSEDALEFIRRHGDEIAAVMVEPVQSRRPELQPREFLQELRRITRQTGALLIFDEMITGFRVHLGGAQAFFGVEADIATYGKVLGGGMPIGVVAGRGNLMDPIDGGMWRYGDNSYPEVNRVVFGGTFCQHPLAMTTTLATLHHLKEQGPALQQQLNQRTARLAEELNRYFLVEEVPIEIVHFGSLFRFSFSGNLELLFYHMMEKGVFIWEWRNYFLSTAHTDADVDFVVHAVQESVAQMRDGGFIPERGQPDALPSEKNIDEAVYPLNEAQRQLSALAQLSTAGSMAYHVNALLRLSGSVDDEALENALRTVVSHHEALRTAIEGDAQRVLPMEQVEAALKRVDLSREADPEAAFADWQQHATTPFDLGRPPLFIARLIKLGEGDYRLALTGHHIVVDGLSMNLIVRQFAAAYNAQVEGTSMHWDPPLQYRDYLRWQAANYFAAPEAYWLEELQGEVPVLELPADRPQAALRTYRGGRIALQLEADLFAQIGELSRRQGCTHFMTLFAAYALWLHRISGQDDLLVGIPVAGRSLKKGDELVGYCTHLVPVRSRIDRQQSFVDYLVAVRGKLLRAYQHQDYPFTRLIEKLELRRDGRRAPLVSALFNLDRPGQVPKMTGLDVGWTSQPIHFTAFDLVFNFTELEDDLVLECDYNGDLFEESTVERLVGHFHTLLNWIVADPESCVSTLPLMEEKEWRRVVLEWNRTESEYPRDRCLHQLFEARAATDAQAIAVAWEGGRLSYGELNARANRLARYLRTAGVGPDRTVGVYTARSPETVVAILAVLKAGGAYLPLDPAYPVARLDFMLQDSGATVLLTQQHLRSSLSPLEGTRVLCLDSEFEACADEAPEDLDNLAAPDSLAYLIYTSGSTGKPKGTMVVHRGVVNYLSWALEFYRTTEGVGIPMHASIGFDATILSLFAPLLSGRRLWLVPEAGQEVEHIKAVLESPDDWSLVKLTPAHLELINAMIPEAQRAGMTRCLVMGGEALYGRTVAPWRRMAPQTRIVNEYGPTETVVGCCVYEAEEPEPGPGPLPIGRPIANARMYILDRSLVPVPVGVTGELFIGGDGVARGYLKRPELTAERFIPVARTGLVAGPQDIPAGVLYRTGDLARWRPDGQILYIGRVDNQVKLRGFRIELDEIEQVFLGHATVRECAVVLDQRSDHDQRLIAYLVPAEGEKIDEMALRSYLSQELPDHMVPAALAVLASMPLTENGKVDRMALPAPARSGSADRAPARTEAEKQIAALWCDLLEVTEVGADDNFFDLGGHSLLVLPLRDRLQELFGRQASPVDIFRYPTVAALARYFGDDEQASTQRRKRKGGAGAQRQKEAYRSLRERRSIRG